MIGVYCCGIHMVELQEKYPDAIIQKRNLGQKCLCGAVAEFVVSKSRDGVTLNDEVGI